MPNKNKISLDPSEMYFEEYETLNIPESKFMILNELAQHFAITPEELVITIVEDLLEKSKKLITKVEEVKKDGQSRNGN